MVYVEKHTNGSRATYHKEINTCITKTTNRNRRRYLLAFHKDQSLDPCYSQYTAMICISCLDIVVVLSLLMIPQYITLVQTKRRYIKT